MSKKSILIQNKSGFYSEYLICQVDDSGFVILSVSSSSGNHNLQHLWQMLKKELTVQRSDQSLNSYFCGILFLLESIKNILEIGFVLVWIIV